MAGSRSSPRSSASPAGLLLAASGLALAVLLNLPVASVAQDAGPGDPASRRALFGETHLHTSWSLDAWIFGNHATGPADAYKYAKGETIKHPLGYDITITTPLDFMGVTDHSEYVGVTKQANTPGSYTSKLPEVQGLIITDPNSKEQQQRAFLALLKIMTGPPIKALMTPEVAGTVWKDNNDAADAANEPGKFTAFCSYEWTSMPDNRNMHRNVFFRDCAKVPEMPYSALDSVHPTDLWTWMDGQRAAGNELLAISHNANLSDGWMYPTDVDSLGRPIDAAWAESRMRNNRLVEMKQVKGQSETHPLLSPNDEFASFAIWNVLLGLPPDSGRVDKIVGSYARQALKYGLAMQDVREFNPYKFGMAGGSDSHNAASPYRQENFFGGHAHEDGTIETRMAGHNFAGIDVRYLEPGGLTGVWAEENTRESIWDAMYRKETFGVSGPRIKVRLFGGWGYKPEMLDDQDWVSVAYAAGVPMGVDLPPKQAEAPTFVVWAVKDPTSANLDRVQIVKGWTKDGQSFECVFDVAWSGEREPDKWTGKVPPINSTVDIDEATYTNRVGSVELKRVWTDPAFDPSQHAFYYARVIEIPKPRWTTIQAKQLGIAPPDVVPPTVQERAWSSPIWYTPAVEAREAAKPGLTVAELTGKGATQLNQQQVEELLVGKAHWYRNNVTGEHFKVSYRKEGQHTVYHVGKNVPQPNEVGDVARNGYEGASSAYFIKDGKVVTYLQDHPFEVVFYKLGDTIYGARSNEFGYANYEILPKPPELIDPLPTAVTEKYAKQNQAEFLHFDSEKK
ncbi:DUF3604 domain-containing protein [Rhizobiales bacterium]|uniref:DUF3604 domain-containing protein n=1 Tax=Hongsoonwoonella zoysiae TaxID=2821844 RepID=UPI001561A3A9|nr:DUF3604 domain-containing protein [Hongsoonwoonella zoysiae]NRG16088.1 DUF3604 domain-containing protein [Hongsoonwoonella zoysiae]